MSLATHFWSKLNDRQRHELLRRPNTSLNASLNAQVADIISMVRADGDAALTKLTRKYDGAELAQFKVAASDISAANEQLTKVQLAAIDLAIANVRSFHLPQRAEDISVETMPGVLCERISHAIDSVGLYVPAGTAALPSAAIMLAVPAVIAGCREIILCTPPRPDGTANPAILAAASRAGVTQIYTVGGAQAIAAMAYGTAGIPKVKKILGPGNAWVTRAKTLVSADPEGAAIDMPAGPSEVLVIGDANASPEFIAADLLSQAEHGVDSQVLLITPDTDLAKRVAAEIDRQVKPLPRATTAMAALQNSRIIITDDLSTAISISNRYAPEHLILQIEGARDALADVRNAGSVFIGRWTPEAVGDYCSGTNHVLPTYGYASTYSGLGLDQYRRQMTVQELSRDGLEGLAEAVISLASLEGLEGHAAAVRRRLEAKS